MMFEVEATLIDQAPAQGPDLLELGFESSFELGIERSHRCNETRNHLDRSANTCLDRHGTTLVYIYIYGGPLSIMWLFSRVRAQV